MGTIMEGMAILDSLQRSSKTCKEVLIQMKILNSEYSYSDHDAEGIVNSAYINIHNSIFEK